MADVILMELVKEVRWKTLKLLEGVDDTQALFVPTGLDNHILWHAGHSLVVVEYLALGGMDQKQPPFAKDWYPKFGPGSKPATITQWPTVAEIVTALIDQRTRLMSLVETLTPTDLSRIVGEAPRNRTHGGMILHGLHDEAGHQGEIHLLKKLWKLHQ